MFPLRDSIPSRRRPVVTILIVVACSIVFLFELSLGGLLGRFLEAYAFVPAHVFQPALFDVNLLDNVRAMLLSMFLHGGWLHIIGNMWFLWVFGDNVEDELGHGGYLLFYLFCGAVAAMGQALVAPRSRIPMIGASGAIAGVLGAYLVWFPWSRVRTLVFLGFFITWTDLPAPLFLIIWFVIQFFSGTLSLAQAAGGGGVAFFAHIGGFLAGVVIALLLRGMGKVDPRRHRAITWE